MATAPHMTTATEERADVVLLAPEVETVPESALHERLVTLIGTGLQTRFAGREDVAVHVRLAWFPDRGDTRIRLDPDVMIVLGRPQADRTSYRQWDEAGVAPAVLVEVRSPDDSDADYQRRLARARRYGVEEAVLVSPFAPGGVRVDHLVVDDADPSRFHTCASSIDPSSVLRVSRLGVGFSGGDDLSVTDERGVWPSAHDAIREFREQAARADAEAARADAEAARAEQLAARLRAAGIDP